MIGLFAYTDPYIFAAYCVHAIYEATHATVLLCAMNARVGVCVCDVCAPEVCARVLSALFIDRRLFLFAAHFTFV